MKVFLFLLGIIFCTFLVSCKSNKIQYFENQLEISQISTNLNEKPNENIEVQQTAAIEEILLPQKTHTQIVVRNKFRIKEAKVCQKSEFNTMKLKQLYEEPINATRKKTNKFAVLSLFIVLVSYVLVLTSVFNSTLFIIGVILMALGALIGIISYYRISSSNGSVGSLEFAIGSMILGMLPFMLFFLLGVAGLLYYTFQIIF